MFVKNNTKRAITVDTVMISPGQVAELSDDLKKHKGLVKVLADGWLSETKEAPEAKADDKAGKK